MCHTLWTMITSEMLLQLAKVRQESLRRLAESGRKPRTTLPTRRTA